MAGKLKYLEVSVTSDAKSLAGYTVLGDVAAVGGGRTLILKRPEGASTARPAKKKVSAKAAPGATKQKATDFTPPLQEGTGTQG